MARRARARAAVDQRMSAHAFNAAVGAKAAERAGAAAGRGALWEAAVGGLTPALADRAGARAAVDQRMSPHTHRAVASAVDTDTSPAGAGPAASTAAAHASRSAADARGPGASAASTAAGHARRSAANTSHPAARAGRSSADACGPGASAASTAAGHARRSAANTSHPAARAGRSSAGARGPGASAASTAAAHASRSAANTSHPAARAGRSPAGASCTTAAGARYAGTGSPTTPARNTSARTPAGACRTSSRTRASAGAAASSCLRCLAASANQSSGEDGYAYTYRDPVGALAHRPPSPLHPPEDILGKNFLAPSQGRALKPWSAEPVGVRVKAQPMRPCSHATRAAWALTCLLASPSARADTAGGSVKQTGDTAISGARVTVVNSAGTFFKEVRTDAGGTEPP